MTQGPDDADADVVAIKTTPFAPSRTYLIRLFF
jgi:hypothetical protein